MGLPKPKRESRIRPKASGPVPDSWVKGAVKQFRRDLANRGVVVPELLSSLSAEEALRLAEAVDKMPVFDVHMKADEVRRAFWKSLEDADRKFRADGEKERQEKAMVALAEVVAAAEGFRQAVAEGRLTCDDLPYVARVKLSEIFRGLDGQGFGEANQEAELKAQLAAQQEEILKLRAAVSKIDPETVALEAEVEAMLASGVPPELYGERADRKEKPPEFLRRVYGKYLEKGREAIYLDEIRKLDPKFVNVLAVTCNKTGVDVSGLVPLRTDRTERVMERVMESVGSTGATRAAKAMHAVKMRNYRK